MGAGGTQTVLARLEVWSEPGKTLSTRIPNGDSSSDSVSAAAVLNFVFSSSLLLEKRRNLNSNGQWHGSNEMLTYR